MALILAALLGVFISLVGVWFITSPFNAVQAFGIDPSHMADIALAPGFGVRDVALGLFFADDVVCGHGSTAGQLDQDMLFYLRARGIAEAEVRSLLIAAFVGEALDKIHNEALRAALDEKVAAWLAGTMLDPVI